MNNEKREIRNRVNGLGWALFLIMSGILWLLPAGIIPSGSWLIATGAILLAVNLVKNALGVKTTSGYFFGTLFTLFGIMRLIETPFHFLPIFFIAIGALTIISGLFEIRFKSGDSENLKMNQKED